MASSAAAVRQGGSKQAAKPRYSFYQKIFFLYFLNIADWVCTEALLSTGRFFEANPLMRPVLGGFLPTLLIKGVLPFVLTLICCAIYKASGIGESRLANGLLYTGIIIYAAVNLWHILNFLLLFFLF